jgi:restriction endonuclease S subunit
MQYSIVNFKTLRKNNDGFRYDAEYFQRDYLALEDLLEQKKSISLCGLVKKIDVGHVGSMVSEYSDDGVLLLQTQNVQEFFLNLDGCKRINASFHTKLKKSQIHYGDILIARSGSFGNASIYLEKDTINSADIIIVEGNIRDINVFYLCAFLNSEIGKNQMYRFASGGLQGHVNLTILENLKIPVPAVLFQQCIERIIKNAYLLKNTSENLYSQAEQTLLSELGLLNWKPKHLLSFVKNFSDTQSADRTDAEYFQPMYEEILNRSKDKVKTFRADAIFTFRRGDFIDTKYYSKQKTKRAYIRIKELSNIGSINSNEVIYLEEAFNDASQNTLKENDIVMAIIGDTIGKSNLILKEFAGSYFSNNTGRFRLRPETKDSYDPFYLETLFHSIYIQSQIERAKAQTGQPKIADKEIKDISIPCISKDKQGQIGHNVKKAIENKDQSKRLLDIAKRGVEMAIKKS